MPVLRHAVSVVGHVPQRVRVSLCHSSLYLSSEFSFNVPQCSLLLALPSAVFWACKIHLLIAEK